MAAHEQDYHYDVAVAGAGVAGLAAAVAAAERGARVVVLDDGAAAGGCVARYPRVGAGALLLGEDAAGRALAARLADRAARAGALLRPATTVWGLFTGWTLPLAVRDDAGEETGDEIRARCVVVATGAVDAPLPFAGWTLPGVLTAGAARELLHVHGILPGRRALIAGSSPAAVALALDLAEAGVEVAGLVEAWPRSLAADGVLAGLGERGIPLLCGTAIDGVAGAGGVHRVALQATGRRWTLEVDALIAVAGEVPEATLARLAGAVARFGAASGVPALEYDATLRTAAAGVYVAGAVAGATSLDVALAQGALAGLQAAAEALGRPAPPDLLARYARAIGDGERVAAAAWRAAPAPDGHPLLRFLPAAGAGDVLICRCEDLSLSAVLGAIGVGARSQDAVKRLTRAGMGICQGRCCESIISGLVAREAALDLASLEPMTARAPARPIGVAALAGLSAHTGSLNEH